MPGLGRRLERRFFSATLDEDARSQFENGLERWRAEALFRSRYCLLASYRRDGRPVPTPLWFAPFEDGICFRTAAGSGKVGRMRRHPEVAVAPCTWRGRPLGPAMAGRASFLTGIREGAAETALAQRYGPRRAIYKRTVGSGDDVAYLKIGPAGRPT